MASTLETRPGRRAAARTTPEARDYMSSTRDGWRVVSGGDRCGLVAHRGVLHPNDYIDAPRLRVAVEERLGFTLDELRSVYRQGRLTAEGRELRGRIDARFLELRDADGNLELLARVIGIDRKVIGRALARARQSRQVWPVSGVLWGDGASHRNPRNTGTAAA